MHPGAALAALAGLTVTVSPYAYSLGQRLNVAAHAAWPLVPPSWLLALGCVLLAAGGLAMNAGRRWDQAIITAGVAVILAALGPALVERPSLALAVLLLGGSLIFEAWESDAPLQLRRHALIPTRVTLAAAAARAAAWTAGVSYTALLTLFRRTEPVEALIGLTAAAGFLLRWAMHARDERPRSSTAVAAVALAAPVVLWLWSPLAAHAALTAAALTLIPSVSSRRMAQSPDMLRERPAVPLVTSFAALCLGGSLLLMIPMATTPADGIDAIDAVFTAISAVCVTGLIVLDTPVDFTPLGQALILLLIQIGALGIMSYSAAILITLGRRLGLRQEAAVASSLSTPDRSQLRLALRRMLLFTISCEGIGAALLSWSFFNAGDRPGQAIWRGAFTAVSAFCNAGFSLQSNSLIPYQDNAGVLHVVAALIILGGLSPAVAYALPGFLRRERRSAQVSIVAAASAVLLLSCFVLIAALEWNGALEGLSVADRLHNAWFQSATLRTAGFNSISFEGLQPATLAVMMAAMFIGGSPGGTAGGIKTTTAAVMLLAVAAVIRGRRDSTAFGRLIPAATANRAAAIATLGAVSLALTLLALLLTQTIPATSALFEAVSALATVGLSVGATADLDSVGKIVIAAAMFAGRVGPLSMFAFLAAVDARREVSPPPESIDVG